LCATEPETAVLNTVLTIALERWYRRKILKLLARQNRALLIARARKQKSLGLATEVEVGRSSISARVEPTLREIGERGDILKTMHRALADHGLADERGSSQYVTHGKQITEPVASAACWPSGCLATSWATGIIDGVDGRTHYVETANAARLAEIGRGHIVSLDPGSAKAEPRAADLNIRDMAALHGGVYQPSEHLERPPEDRAHQRRSGRLHPLPCPPAGSLAPRWPCRAHRRRSLENP
jgi:hypothetical protein